MFSKKDLQKLIVPLIIEQFLAITIGMADTVMVAERHGIVANGIHEVDGRLALAEIDQIIILDGITGIDEQDIVALGLVVLLECGDGCHAVDTVCAAVVTMRVVRVHDDEIREIRGKCRAPAPEAGKDQRQHRQDLFHENSSSLPADSCTIRQGTGKTSLSIL